jgi:CheY-like chemotaxis protein
MGTILVIDDEKGITTLIEEALRIFGHRVEVARDGHEGVRKFDRNRYDLVITDLRMPGLDGNEVARHIRSSDKRSTPIIGMSGTPWLLENSDFDMVLTKPFPLARLIESLQSFTVAPVGQPVH